MARDRAFTITGLNMAVEQTQLSEGEQVKVAIEELEPHPRNQEIYTNGDISGVVERMREHGYKEEHRILITENKQILSGHRRWRSAKKVGIESVPVEVVEVDSEEEALQRLLLANEYREKTPAEKINEAEAWEEVYQDPDESVNVDTNVKSRTKAVEKASISEGTYSNGKKVKEIATGERDAPRA